MELVELYFYTGSLVDFTCQAAVVVEETRWDFDNDDLDSIIVDTDVATITTVSEHGLYVGASVDISGSLTEELNGRHLVLSVPSATTFTIDATGLDDTAAANGSITPAVTYNDPTVAVFTNDPLLNKPVWRVLVNYWSSTNLVKTLYGGGSISLAFRAVAADRATYKA